MKMNRIFNWVIIFAVVFSAIGWSVSASAAVYNAPSLNYPTNNQVLTNYPRVANFSWSSIYGANNYQVEVACDTCVSKTNKWQNARTYNVVGNTFSVTVPGADNQFRWRVRAVGNMWQNQDGQWSEYRYFTFNTKNQTKINTPNIYLPNNGEQYNQSSIYLDWSDVSSATKYGYEIHKWNTVSSQWESKDSQIISSGVSAVNYNISNWGDGQFRYRVYAGDNLGNKSEWSSWRYFYNTYSTNNNNNNYSYSAPTITEPYANQYFSQGSSVTIRWNSVSNAVSYDVRIEYESNGNWYAESTSNVTALNLVRNFPYSNEYRVSVRAKYSDYNYSNYSDWRYFNVGQSGDNYSSTVPTITEPYASQYYSTGSNVTVRWNSVSNAVSYDVRIEYESNGNWYSESNTNVTSLYLTKYFPYTNEYRVSVRAKYSDYNYSNYSDWRYFNVGQSDSYYNPQSPPTITEPYANQYFSSGQSVTVRWNSVANATSYNVRVEYKSGSNWLIESNTNVNSLYLTKYFYYTNEYRVQVRANFSDGNYTNWSDYRYFNYNYSGSYYGYSYTAPVISTPAENQTLYSRYVFPTWNTISGASLYEINVNYKSGTGWLEEGLYTSVLTSVGLDLKYTNEYRVRVRAKFSDSTYTSWSDWRLFRVQL